MSCLLAVLAYFFVGVFNCFFCFDCRNMDAACGQFGEKTKTSLFQCLHFATSCSSVMQFFSRQAFCNICHIKINTVLEGYHHLFLCHYTEFLKCMVPKCDISSQSKPSFNIKEVTFVAVITYKVKIKDFSIKDDLWLLVDYRTQCSYFNKWSVLAKLIEEVEETLTGKLNMEGWFVYE